MNLKTNKTLSVLIVLAMIISILVPVISFASYEEVQGKLAISSAKGAVGQEVTVTVTAKAETTITNMDSLVKYDRAKLQVTNVKEGSIAGTMMIANDRYNHPAGPDGVVIGVVSTGDPVKVPAGTVFATITFKILEGADKTNSLSYVYDNDAQNALATGAITVEKAATGITLDKESVELNISDNKKAEVVATIVPEDADNAEIKWSSSNDAVATVNGNGKNATITAVAKGTADITATVNGKTATCKVVVSPAPLTNITLSEPPAKVEIDKTFKFTVTPNEGAEVGTINWETSDKEIATVDQDGTVHPVKEGEVTITAKVGEISASKTFTVKKANTVEVPGKEDPEGEIKVPGVENTGANQENAQGQNENEASKSEEKASGPLAKILPNTGDMAVYTFVALMVVSATGIVFVVRKNRK